MVGKISTSYMYHTQVWCISDIFQRPRTNKFTAKQCFCSVSLACFLCKCWALYIQSTLSVDNRGHSYLSHDFSGYEAPTFQLRVVTAVDQADQVVETTDRPPSSFLQATTLIYCSRPSGERQISRCIPWSPFKDRLHIIDGHGAHSKFRRLQMSSTHYILRHWGVFVNYDR